MCHCHAHLSHTVQGKHVFLEGKVIPGWGSRTCATGDLDYFCKGGFDSFGDQGDRKDMIKHCCDTSQENNVYHWTFCWDSDPATIATMPKDNCHAALSELRSGGSYFRPSNCYQAESGSDCLVWPEEGSDSMNAARCRMDVEARDFARYYFFCERRKNSLFPFRVHAARSSR